MNFMGDFVYWWSLRRRFEERLGRFAIGPFGPPGAPFVIRRWGEGRPRTIEDIEPVDPWVVGMLERGQTAELRVFDTEDELDEYRRHHVDGFMTARIEQELIESLA